MSYGFLDIATTPSVRAAQAEMGADAHWAAFSGNRAFDRFTDNEAHFLAARDSFYMATVSGMAGPMSSIAAARPASSSWSTIGHWPLPIIAATANISAPATWPRTTGLA